MFPKVGRVDTPLAATAVLALAAALAAKPMDFIAAPCAQRATDIAAGNNPLYSCGSTSCPENAKTTAVVGDQADLPEGWFVYVGRDPAPATTHSLYWSPLNAFKPTVIPNTNDANVVLPVGISDDGNWILYGPGILIKRDGSGKTAVPNNSPSKKAVFYRKSPKASGSKVEIAYLMKYRSSAGTQNEYRAVLADLSGATPTFSGDRVIVSKDAGAWDSWIAAGGSSFFTQERVVVPGRADSIQYQGTVWQIPDNGNGIATAANKLSINPLYTWSCGMAISWDGLLTAANYGHGNQDCFPDNHKGFAVIPIAPPAAGADPKDWMSRPGVTVNWCPASYAGADLRAGTNADQEFHDWSFANYSDWVVGVHRLRAPYGVWLVNRQTNTWTPLTNPAPSDLVDEPAVFFTKDPGTSAVRKHGLARPPAAGPAFDALGRDGASGPGAKPASVIPFHKPE